MPSLRKKRFHPKAKVAPKEVATEAEKRKAPELVTQAVIATRGNCNHTSSDCSKGSCNRGGGAKGCQF